MASPCKNFIKIHVLILAHICTETTDTFALSLNLDLLITMVRGNERIHPLNIDVRMNVK